METLIVQPKTQKQLAAVEAVLKALNVGFKKTQSPYDPTFVSQINKSRKQAKDGKVITYTKDQLQELCK